MTAVELFVSVYQRTDEKTRAFMRAIAPDWVPAGCSHEWEVKPGRLVWTCKHCGVYRMDVEAAGTPTEQP